MRKNIFKIIFMISLIILINKLLVLCIYKHDNKKEIKTYFSNETNYNYKMNNMVIKISKINLYSVVKKASKNFSNLNKNIVYYRNNDYNGKIIIFGHSGLSYGMFFNRIDELESKDEVILYINNKEIIYKYSDKFEILETQTDILKNDSKNTLLLITCKKSDNTKRIVLKFIVKDIKPLKNKKKIS